MSNRYAIMLDPALSISVDDLADAWAKIPECAAAGSLVRDDARSPGSFSYDVASMVVGALIASGAGLSKDLIVVLVKRALERADTKASRRRAERVKVDTIRDQQTGLPIIRVTRGEREIGRAPEGD